MSTETRRSMLAILSDDLLAGSWDQDPKFWVCKGTDDDEYLEFVDSFQSDPTHWMIHRAEEGEIAADVRALVLAWESWVYPAALADRLATSPTAGAAFQQLIEPEDHPNREQSRTIVFIARDGAVIATCSYSDRPRVWDTHPNMPLIGNTNWSLVDLARCVLGINQDVSDEIASALAQVEQVRQIIQRAANEGWSEDRTGMEIYRTSPPDKQEKLRQQMPQYLLDLLAAEEQPGG